MGMRVLRGRGFAQGDRAGTLPVAVINLAMARRYWPKSSALGAQIRFGDDEVVSVIGVVSSVRHSLTEDDPSPRIYRPYEQAPSSAMFLVLRGGAKIASVGPAVRRKIRELDPGLPLPTMTLMDASLQDSVRPTRYLVLVLSSFGLTAILVSALGLFGLLRFRAYQEEHEVAIRLALGAPRGLLVRTRLIQGLCIAAAGIVLGVTVLVAAAPFVEHELPAMQHSDGTMLFLAAFVSAFVAALASVVPACRVLTMAPSDINRFG